MRISLAESSIDSCCILFNVRFYTAKTVVKRETAVTVVKIPRFKLFVMIFLFIINAFIYDQ